jgi:hypothetical protein
MLVIMLQHSLRGRAKKGGAAASGAGASGKPPALILHKDCQPLSNVCFPTMCASYQLTYALMFL